MDAYDVMMDKYKAEQRFREEIKKEVARIKCTGKHDGTGDEYLGHGHNYNVYKCSICGQEYDY